MQKGCARRDVTGTFQPRSHDRPRVAVHIAAELVRDDPVRLVAFGLVRLVEPEVDPIDDEREARRHVGRELLCRLAIVVAGHDEGSCGRVQLCEKVELRANSR